MEKCFLCSVKVSGEGVDTKHCDSVYWADVRGSMPEVGVACCQSHGRSS
ncbi:hypothetical protein [Streptomyces violascens]